MHKGDVIDLLKKRLNFSDKSIAKLGIFHDSLLEFNSKYNLIAKSTENSIWTRHILDSAQIIESFDHKKVNKIADFGSGAGLPGLIISIFDENRKFHVKLYEKSPVKRDFLARIRKKLDLKIDIIDNVYAKEINADLIVCRAFKKLDAIINISREIVEKPHKLIILKGKNAQAEINKVSLRNNYSYKMKDSITDNKSKIIILDVKK